MRLPKARCKAWVDSCAVARAPHRAVTMPVTANTVVVAAGKDDDDDDDEWMLLAFF